MRFQIDWASLITGSKFTVFTLFYFVFEGNFPSISPPKASIWRGDLTEGFLHYRFGGLYLEGLIHGGAYFRDFTVRKQVWVTFGSACKHQKRPQQWNPYQKGTGPQSYTTGCLPLGSLSNKAGDGNENGKKAIGLISRTITLHVHHDVL